MPVYWTNEDERRKYRRTLGLDPYGQSARGPGTLGPGNLGGPANPQLTAPLMETAAGVEPFAPVAGPSPAMGGEAATLRSTLLGGPNQPQGTTMARELLLRKGITPSMVTRRGRFLGEMEQRAQAQEQQDRAQAQRDRELQYGALYRQIEAQPGMERAKATVQAATIGAAGRTEVANITATWQKDVEALRQKGLSARAIQRTKDVWDLTKAKGLMPDSMEGRMVQANRLAEIAEEAKLKDPKLANELQVASIKAYGDVVSAAINKGQFTNEAGTTLNPSVQSALTKLMEMSQSPKKMAAPAATPAAAPAGEATAPQSEPWRQNFLTTDTTKLSKEQAKAAYEYGMDHKTKLGNKISWADDVLLTRKLGELRTLFME